MEQRLPVLIIILLFGCHICDRGPGRPECSGKLGNICAVSGSDAELRFLKASTCNVSDVWRVEKTYNDIYICRNGYLAFAQEHGGRKMTYDQMTGLISLPKVQQLDEGLYRLCHDHLSCTCVKLVVKPDEKGCQEASGQTDQEIKAPPTNSANISTIMNIPTIIFGVILFILLI